MKLPLLDAANSTMITMAPKMITPNPTSLRSLFILASYATLAMTHEPIA